MKKRLIGFSVLTAALTLATGITAFAGTWKQDSVGWYYEHDNGNIQGIGWFTDPADGSIYYMDPDGYMMAGTTVEGYKLGDDGRRIEKTEEDIRKEQERKQRIASKPSPAKEQAAAELAAAAAKTAVSSTSTTRLSYQSEMKTFMDKHYIAAFKELTANNSESVERSVIEDNIETTYRFQASGGPVAEACLWKMSNKESLNYKPEAIIMTYNRNLLGDANDIAIFEELFRNMNIAALGETEGQAVTDYYNAEVAAGNTRFDRTGNTDTGNSYTLAYRSGKVTISVVCSEYVAPVEGAENAETETGTAAEAAPVEEAAVSKVLVAGAGQAVEEETVEETAAENTAEEAAVEETAEEAAAEETAAEEAAETAAEEAAE